MARGLEDAAQRSKQTDKARPQPSKTPSTLEPIGLSRKDDNKRLDGLTYTTLKNGKCLIWDFTFANTLCKSFIKKSFTEVGAAAAGQEDKKVEKYL